MGCAPPQGWPGWHEAVVPAGTSVVWPCAVIATSPSYVVTLVVLSGLFSRSKTVPRTPATAVGVVIWNDEFGFISFSALDFTFPENRSILVVTVFVRGSMSMSLIVKFVNGVSFITFAELHLTTAADFAPVFIIVPFGNAMFACGVFHAPPGSITCTSPVNDDNVALTGTALSLVGAKIASAIKIADSMRQIDFLLPIITSHLFFVIFGEFIINVEYEKLSLLL